MLITGTSSGLGAALAKVFEEKGWNVIATVRKDLDVGDQSSLDEFVATLGGKPIDVLINNAGVYDAPPEDDDAVISKMDEVANALRINSAGPRILSEALIPNLKAGSEKLIVTISSGMGTFAKLNDYSARHWPYSASKAALNYEMTSFNRLFPDIKSVLVHPGSVKTKIGGEQADMEPIVSAEKIYGLIENHESKLVVGKINVYDGSQIEL